jgi:hypothetical protein
MKAEKEAQEMMSRRRVEETQRQQILQRMGNGTPGQSHVCDILRILRTLTSTVSRARRRFRSIRARRKDKDRGRDNLHHSQGKTIMPRGLN